MRILVVAIATLVVATEARADGWEARPADGRILVHVYKKGLFSGFAHDHHFEVTDWRATLEIPGGDPAAASVEVVLSADSLHDRQEKLSENDRAKVDAKAASPEVLDAEHHPGIEFRSERLDLEPGGDGDHLRGTAHGTLTLRGQSSPADLVVRADRAAGDWRVAGSARLKQTRLGIKPFSGFAGTVSVKDELEVELALTLKPRSP